MKSVVENRVPQRKWVTPPVNFTKATKHGTDFINSWQDQIQRGAPQVNIHMA